MNDGESWLPRTLRGMEIDRRVEVSIRQWPRGDRALATHGNTSAVAERRVVVPVAQLWGPAWELWEAKGPLKDWAYYDGNLGSTVSDLGEFCFASGILWDWLLCWLLTLCTIAGFLVWFVAWTFASVCVCLCLCMSVCLRVVYVCECVSFCCLFLIASVCVHVSIS